MFLKLLLSSFAIRMHLEFGFEVVKQGALHSSYVFIFLLENVFLVSARGRCRASLPEAHTCSSAAGHRLCPLCSQNEGS